ncbi:Cation/H+ exchanger [Scenedesmus sp. NREL 46B-D3]|nr:Cation/H+ exchanger [Scenedesmus sp. NREL 46B-D3]
MSAALQLALLAVAISVGHLLRRKRVLWIGGAGAALLLGVVVGVMIRLAHTAPLVDSWMVFQSDFFFLVLLPPIMFDACLNLDSRLFIKNIGSVCALAFAGTTVSTFAVGLTMWAAGQLRLCFALRFLEALTFGALISATDPVTVLAIFQALGADPDLYMNVFGESVLNDAVAMVLFQTCSGFASKEVPVTAANIAKGKIRHTVASIFTFGGIFLGSIVLGVTLGLAAAALLRSRWYYGETNLETGLMLLLGYASYMAGAAAGLSGIVSVMFCAMVCRAYCAPNLSPGGLQAARSVFAVLSSCMETFVFVYIGVTLFMQPQEWHCVKFAAMSLFGLAWSRAANVLPCCAAINWVRQPQLAISRRQQLVLWWSGLRGAMAFALSVEAAKLFGEAGKVMMTSTFIVILITVLINGGSTAFLLDWCGLVQEAAPHESADYDGARQQQDAGSDYAFATQAGGAGSAASDSRPTLLQRLRANGDGLQQQLDHWDAAVLHKWFINPESASQHGPPGRQ